MIRILRFDISLHINVLRITAFETILELNTGFLCSVRVAFLLDKQQCVCNSLRYYGLCSLKTISLIENKYQQETQIEFIYFFNNFTAYVWQIEANLILSNNRHQCSISLFHPCNFVSAYWKLYRFYLWSIKYEAVLTVLNIYIMHKKLYELSIYFIF